MRLNEESLEALIVKQMVDGGWQEGASTDYEPAYALDLPQLVSFIEATQPDLVDALSLHAESPTRHAFLSRVQGEVTKRGVVEVLRKGIGHNQHHVDFFYPTPSVGNAKAVALFAENRFTVTRAVSGLFFATSHRAKSNRVGRPSVFGSGGITASTPGSTVDPFRVKSPPR